jgi:hypothetical protein
VKSENEMRSSKREALKRDVLRSASNYREVFSSIEGQKVLDALKREFRDRAIHVPGDSHGTHVRVGECNVINHIMGMMTIGDENNAPTVDEV